MRLFLVIQILLLPVIRDVAQTPAGRSYPTSDSLLNMLKSYYTDSIHPVSATYFHPGINVDERVRIALLRLIKQEWPPAVLKARVENDFRSYFEDLYLQHILETAGSLYHRKDRIYDSVYRASFDSMATQLLKDSGKISAGIRQTIAENVARDQASIAMQLHLVSYDSIYRRIYDSSARWFRTRRARELQQGPVANELVQAVALSRITEAIPFLKNDVEKDTTVHRYKRVIAELALAALGDPVYKEKFMAQHRKKVAGTWQLDEMDFDFDGLALFIGTQQSIALLADWMDTTQTYKMFSERENDTQAPTVYFSGHLIPSLIEVVKNKDLAIGVKRLIKIPPNLPPGLLKGAADFLDESSINPAQIVFVKQWLLANKGKYHLD